MHTGEIRLSGVLCQIPLDTTVWNIKDVNNNNKISISKKQDLVQRDHSKCEHTHTHTHTLKIK